MNHSTWFVSSYRRQALALVVAMLFALCTNSSVTHGLTIDLGTYDLLADTAWQPIELRVSGGEAVEAVQFEAQVSGADVRFGGTDGPNIQQIDIVTGTIVEQNNTGVVYALGSHGLEEIVAAATTTEIGAVPADGLIATLYLDTTGFSVGDGPFTLELITLNGGTKLPPFRDEDTQYLNPVGILNIVPEPTAFTLAAVALLGLMTSRRKRRVDVRRPLAGDNQPPIH